MSALSHIERQKLERALGMEGGYVLSFSNRTFEEFFRTALDIDICRPKYQIGSGSKANRMRAFWNTGSSSEILRLFESLLEGWEIYGTGTTAESKAYITDIVARLQRDIPEPKIPPTQPFKLDSVIFPIALSFPGTKRDYVEKVARQLTKHLGPNQVFYDKDYQAHLARPNLDILLQHIYQNQSELVVIFLAAEYERSEWCGLEWRAIRDMIKTKKSDQLMFVRFDQADINGTFSIDGYIDATQYAPERVAEFVLHRAGLTKSTNVDAPASQFPSIKQPNPASGNPVEEIIESLLVIKRETRHLWRSIIELSPTNTSCTSEAKRSTITRIGTALKHLEDNGLFRFSSTFSYDEFTTKEPVFKVSLEGMSPQLVNLAHQLEKREPSKVETPIRSLPENFPEF